MENINSNYNYSYPHIRERIETLEKNLPSIVYKHHFDLVLTSAQTGLPNDTTLRFNCVSTTKTPYAKFGDLDGDGFIMSAFGEQAQTVIFDARLLYQGNLLVYVSNLTDNSVKAYIIPNMADVVIFDSVTRI